MEVKQAENDLDKALIQVGKEFYDATIKADEDFALSANVAMENYRKSRENSRVKYEQTLKQAEIDFNAENALAVKILDEAPVKAKTDYELAKRQAREIYEKKKSELFEKHNKLLSDIAAATMEVKHE